MRTDTTIRDVMHREFLGVSESDPLRDAAALLVDEETNCLVVLRGGEPVGRLGCRDALETLLDVGAEAAGDTELTVGSVMGPPLPTVAPDDALVAAEERLIAEGNDRVVAVEDGEAVGVVTAGDVLAAGAPRTGDGVRDALSEEAATGEPQRGDAAMLGSDGGVDPAVEASSTDASGSPTQGVCESCGALVPDLVSANGQAICPECRDV
ncbi:CBS domain-containing protein [Halorubrum sp. N11]|uniref:CBS domain-containing protein n=1 Tax=Halorubrum sp. N11 TaxID=3402276 RepID=UPI003EBB760D